MLLSTHWLTSPSIGVVPFIALTVKQSQAYVIKNTSLSHKPTVLGCICGLPPPPPPLHCLPKKRLPFSAPIQFIPEPVSPGLSSHLVEQFGPSIWENYQC